MIKFTFGAAVVVADIIGGVTVQRTLHQLHKQAHPHYIGVIGLCAVLAVANLILIALVRRSQAAKAAKAAATRARPAYSSFPFRGYR